MMQVPFKDNAYVDLCTQACGQQVQPTQLAMQEDGISRWRVPVALFEAQGHAGVANAPGQVARAKVKASTGSGRLGG